MNPNRNRYRRMGREYLWPVGRRDVDIRQKQLVEFLLKKSGKHQSINPPQEPSSAHDSQTEAQFDLMNAPDDLLLSIFALLPAETLIKLQFACKKWFSLINSPLFVKFHAQHSGTVLISRELFFDEIPCPFLSSAERTKPHFHFLDPNRANHNFVESTALDLSCIRASFNGLVLGVRSKNKGMVLLNPLTRKSTDLPLGTLGFKECYGLSSCIRSRNYKVAHLFREDSGYTACEILNVTTRKWSVINGPCPELLQDIRQRPVPIPGFLYWMPRQHGCDYFLALDLGAEEFKTMKLPIFCAANDRLVEAGGALAFVTHATLNMMQVWMLSKSGSWMKRYSINLNFDATRVVPVCSLGKGRSIVMECPGGFLYVCDMENGSMRMVFSREKAAEEEEEEEEEGLEGVETMFVPHRNTLESWEDV